MAPRFVVLTVTGTHCPGRPSLHNVYCRNVVSLLCKVLTQLMADNQHAVDGGLAWVLIICGAASERVPWGGVGDSEFRGLMHSWTAVGERSETFWVAYQVLMQVWERDDAKRDDGRAMARWRAEVRRYGLNAFFGGWSRSDYVSSRNRGHIGDE